MTSEFNIHPSLLRENIKYAPKLSHDHRCEILAFDWMGVNRNVIAAAYGVNRSTVAYICNASSPHYNSVRQAFADVGKEAFIKEHIDEDKIAHMNSFVKEPEAEMSNEEVRESKARKANTPDHRANKYGGQHAVYLPAFDASISVLVLWGGEGTTLNNILLDLPEKSWYIVITEDQAAKVGIELDAPLIWNSDPGNTKGEPFNTSRLALDAYLKINEGKLIK